MRRVVGLLLMFAVAAGGLNACNSSKSGERGPSLGLTREPDLTGADSAKTAAANAMLPGTVTRQAWQFNQTPGMQISSAHYRIYTTIDNERILDRLPMFYERVLQQYTTALAKLPKPEAPLETYLFQSRNDLQTKAQEMVPDQAQILSNLGRGGFTTRGISVLYYIDRFGMRDTFAIAAHEGWHQYSQQTFKHQLPIWLEEGVATYMEGYRTDRETGLPEFLPWANFERREALRDAVRSRHLISLDKLLTRSPQSFLVESKDALLVYYAQVWALTRFLAEGEDGRYQSALAALLTETADGKLVGRMLTSDVNAGTRRRTAAEFDRVGPSIAEEYFNRDLTELERQYLAFIDVLVKGSDMPAGMGGPPNRPPR